MSSHTDCRKSLRLISSFSIALIFVVSGSVLAGPTVELQYNGNRYLFASSDGNFRLISAVIEPAVCDSGPQAPTLFGAGDSNPASVQNSRSDTTVWRIEAIGYWDLYDYYTVRLRHIPSGRYLQFAESEQLLHASNASKMFLKDASLKKTTQSHEQWARFSDERTGISLAHGGTHYDHWAIIGANGCALTYDELHRQLAIDLEQYKRDEIELRKLLSSVPDARENPRNVIGHIETILSPQFEAAFIDVSRDEAISLYTTLANAKGLLLVNQYADPNVPIIVEDGIDRSFGGGLRNTGDAIGFAAESGLRVCTPGLRVESSDPNIAGVYALGIKNVPRHRMLQTYARAYSLPEDAPPVPVTNPETEPYIAVVGDVNPSKPYATVWAFYDGDLRHRGNQVGDSPWNNRYWSDVALVGSVKCGR